MIALEKSNPVKKSSVEIRFDILEFLYYHAGTHSRTSLWRHATKLSYDDFQRYLASLADKEFVEEFEEGISLTLAGKEVYLKLREALPQFFESHAPMVS